MQRTKSLIHNSNNIHTCIKPLVYTIECNVDASSFNNNSIFGIVCVLETPTRFFLLDKSDYFHFFASILEAETMDLLEAFKVSILNGMHVVLFETNRKSLSNSLANTHTPLNKFDDLVSQCRYILLSRANFVMSYFLRLSHHSLIFFMMYQLLYII